MKKIMEDGDRRSLTIHAGRDYRRRAARPLSYPIRKLQFSNSVDLGAASVFTRPRMVHRDQTSLVKGIAVVFVHARLEGSDSNRILSTQTEFHHHGVAGSKRVK